MRYCTALSCVALYILMLLILSRHTVQGTTVYIQALSTVPSLVQVRILLAGYFSLCQILHSTASYCAGRTRLRLAQDKKVLRPALGTARVLGA